MGYQRALNSSREWGMFEHFLVHLYILNSLKGANVCNKIPHTLEIPVYIWRATSELNK
jgi:hypothetical protein